MREDVEPGGGGEEAAEKTESAIEGEVPGQGEAAGDGHTLHHVRRSRSMRSSVELPR